MAQELKLTLFEKGDFQDDHGNYWCTATFELPDGSVEDHVKWVVKDPMSVKQGENYYGDLEEKTGKSGKPYLRFYRKQREDGEGGHSVAKPSAKTLLQDDTYWEDKNSAIKAQWAIGQAVHCHAESNLPFADIERVAIEFYAMVDRVKGSSESTDPKVSSAPQTQSLPDKPFTSTEPEDTTDEDWRSLTQSLDKGIPIELI